MDIALAILGAAVVAFFAGWLMGHAVAREVCPPGAYNLDCDVDDCDAGFGR